MVKVLLNGATGHMGSEVISSSKNFEDVEIVGGFDIKKQDLPFPVFTDFSEISVHPDVIIDFSIPAASIAMLEYAQKNKIPMVIATTGITDEQMEIIKKASENIPIFKSNNMSFDIQLMNKIVSIIAPILKDTDIEIIETHHNRKIDSPSGTALTLADTINEATGHKYTYNLNRFEKKEKRSKNEIGFSSIRGGNIVGEHTVKFFGEKETFEITHTSYSRGVFAEGAIKAAMFLVNKKSGLYNMKDLV